MISIIICSQYPQLSQEVHNSLSSTIGVPYELVYVFNEDNKYSIFEAYQKGAQQAKGDILCFMHNDVLFYSQNWGQIVEQALMDSSVGGCAVAGVQYLRCSPAYYPVGHGMNRINLIQSTPNGNLYWHDYDQISEIVAFDGLWFCIKAECFRNIHFDTQTYSGFHFYDIDIALQLHENGYKIVCLPNIKIKHLSGGHTNESWLRNSFAFAFKWSKSLPLTCVPINADLAKHLELSALYSSLKSICQYKAFDLLHQWTFFAKQICGYPLLISLWLILYHHFTNKHTKS